MWRQLVMKAVQRVIRPKQTVVQLKKAGGPTRRIMMVAGSWAQMDATVKMKMATEKRFPVKSKSLGIDVTAAEEMMPLSSKFKLHRMPAMVHSLKSILRNKFRLNVSSPYSFSGKSTAAVAVVTDLGCLFDGASCSPDDEAISLRISERNIKSLSCSRES